MRLVLVNRYFHPDLAPTGRLGARLAFAEAAAGREVLVFCSRQRYEDARAVLPPEELAGGTRIRRVWSTRFGRGGLAGRALDYLSFHISVGLALLRRLRHGDTVIAMTDPPLLSVTVALAALLRGARLVNWLQDVFPETAARSGFRLLAGPMGAVCRALRNWSLRRAAANVVLGARMAGVVRAAAPAVDVTVIPNWADGRAIRPAERPVSPALLVVGYSGNLGRVHDVQTLLDAARRLVSEPGMRLRITGGGFHFARIRECGLPNVEARDYVPEDQLSASLADCDIHLVSLRPVFEGLVVPSKFYAIAAAGRPTVFIGAPDGEIAGLLAEHRLGVTVAEGDGEGLVAALLRLRDDAHERLRMGARARAVFEKEWDEPVALGRWRTLLVRIAAPAR